MKNIFLSVISLCFCLTGLSIPSEAQNNDSSAPVSFSSHFIRKTLRIDYYMAGDNKETTVYMKGMKQEPYWGGSLTHLIDPFNSGSYRYMAMDSATGEIIFTRGFCNLFQEWQGTPEAKKVKRAFAQTAVMPFPTKTIRFEIDRRDYNYGKFYKIFELYINPNDYFISREKITEYPVVKFRNSGDPSVKVDIAFIAEGYTSKEMDKFLSDARRISSYILSMTPYSENADKFNFYAIESPSAESGVTIPGTGQYVNTSVHSSFYTFDMDRYLTSFDTYAFYDIAANTPYDAIFVLVNSKRYGGGGFYNHYCESTVDNPLSEIVSIHEFGHAFAGLADEYYTSEVTYSDFYNLKVEPWEANITTNVDFDSKWKKMVTPGIPIPTPRTEKFKNDIGMFEGGGYVAKGVYSPMMDCRMKSNEAPGFCPVCKEQILKTILLYCE
ncbi:MAG: M64 family metallopeptidase [Bacteroidota bacterium]|nr:M64 family metallopeptidase [Bacteroidota bacterium]